MDAQNIVSHGNDHSIRQFSETCTRQQCAVCIENALPVNGICLVK